MSDEKQKVLGRIRAALSGELAQAQFQTDPIFNLDVPQSVPGVPSEVLNPRNTWKSADEYDAQARKLAAMFSGGGMEKALGGLAPGGQLPGGMPGLPGLGGGAPGFNLPPGFDKFSKK